MLSKNKRGIIVIAIIILGLCIFTIGIIIGIEITKNNDLASQKEKDNYYSKTLNQSFDYLFENKIKTYSEEKIQNIVDKVNRVDNETEKVAIIANEIALEFKYVDYKNWSVLDPNGLFFSNQEGCVRIGDLNSNSLGQYNRSLWTLYFGCGACGEIAGLFDVIALRSGLDARIVNPNIDHAWNEVNIDDEWKYIDLTMYWAYYNGNNYYSDKWFNKTCFYKFNSGIDFSKIQVSSTNEDITLNYPSDFRLCI